MSFIHQNSFLISNSFSLAFYRNSKKNEQHAQQKKNKQISMPGEKSQTAQESKKT